ncbi:MAG: nucleotide sugar dehydrogenase, partial [bacterium]
MSFRYRVVPVLDENDRVVDAEFYQETEGRDDIKNRRISVVGLGFVGLTLAVTLADVGFTVTGIDKDPDVVESLRNGTPPFYESGLEMYLNRVLDRRFSVSNLLDPNQDDVYIVAVGTPVDSETKEPQLEAVKEATRQVGRALKTDDLVILRSTVPVGTTRNEVLPILEGESGLDVGDDFGLVFAPERTIAGNALNELRDLPQIVGAIDEESQIEASRLFNEVTDSIVKVESLEAAEMSKIIDNSYRDVTFAYANQMAKVCEAVGLDMSKLVDAVNLGYDRNQVPKPSPGVGGACLSKDPYILNYVGEQHGEQPDLVRTARRVNESMPTRVASDIRELLSKTEKNEPFRLFVLGFAFKGQPETSDMRNSPTLDLIDTFDDGEVELSGYDPAVSEQAIQDLGVTPVSPEEGFNGTDAAVIMTNHPDFSKLDIF